MQTCQFKLIIEYFAIVRRINSDQRVQQNGSYSLGWMDPAKNEKSCLTILLYFSKTSQGEIHTHTQIWATCHSSRMILPSRPLICMPLSSNTYSNKPSKGQSDLEFLCSKISYSRSRALQCSSFELHVNSPDQSEPGLSISWWQKLIYAHITVQFTEKMKPVQCKY